MEPIDRRMLLGAAGIAGVAAMTKLAGAGPLNPPPGPVSPTGRTLDEIYGRIARTDVGVAEPRIPVQSLPGSATALHVISEPGSYYLTGNIQGVAGKNGIEIAADQVSIDLMGFGLRGVSGSLNGILGGVSRLLCVHGGSTRGWGERGIQLADTGEATVSDFLALQNGLDGIHTGTASLIERCVARENGFAGLAAFSDSVIAHCVARNNGFAGISTGFACRIEACTASFNRWGLNISGGNYILGCVCGANADVGIKCTDNGQNRIDRNSVLSNGTGFLVASSGNVVMCNTAQANGTNYNIAPGNSHGPIVNVAGVGDISSVPGANHPWANFIY